MARREITKAFVKWSETVRAARNWAAMSRKRMVLNLRRRAFAKWANGVLVTNQNAKMAAARFRQLASRLQREAFRTWEIAIGDRRALRIAATKVLGECVKVGKAWAFKHWSTLVARRRAE